MPSSNKWWILCAVSLYCLARFGSCRRDRAHGTPPELFIFNELCALKDDPGPCKALKERFFFNVDTGRCDTFHYGGCKGNANNFETLEECEEMCVVSDDKNPCHLPEAEGPCRGLAKRYLFDSEIQQCRSFFYGGCFGNANNFRTMADCQAKCHNPAKTTTEPEVQTQSARKADAVQPTIVTGELTASEPLVQVNTSNQETRDGELTASEPLVQVNTNNQETRNDHSPAEQCFSPVDRGTCHGVEKRFAYNSETRRCQVFIYSGCGGNRNNFTSRKHCIHTCIKSRRGHGRKMIRIRKKNLDSIANRSA